MNESQQIVKKIRLLEEELYNIQEKCLHLMVEKIPSHYNPSDGDYCIGNECFCPECLKRWKDY